MACPHISLGVQQCNPDNEVKGFMKLDVGSQTKVRKILLESLGEILETFYLNLNLNLGM